MSLRLVTLDEVEPEETPWLWPEWIAKGVLTFVVGEPGVGKSSMSWDLAARFSTGGPWPDGERSEKGRSLIISGEDHLGNRIAPQLRKYGADTSLVASLDPAANSLKLDRDCGQLEQLVREQGVGLVVIDPLDAFLGDVNPNYGSEIRTITNGLSGMAARTGCSVVVLHHFNKNEGASDGNRVAGSIDIVGAARTVIYVVQDPSDAQARAMFVYKSNLGQRPNAMLYRLGSDERLQWCEAPEGFDPKKAMKAKVDGVVDEAADFLQQLMAEHDWVVPASVIQSEADAAGISRNALRQAKVRLGLVSRKTGGTGANWVWCRRDDSQEAA